MSNSAIKLRFLICSFIFLNSLVFTLWAQQTEGEFGTIAAKLDDNPEKQYHVTQAFVYRRAALDFDTTALIQDEDDYEILYYPQINAGKEYILRLILKLPETPGEDFYDVFINMGDSLKKSYNLEDKTSKIFITHNGKLQKHKQYVENVTGLVLVNQDLETQEMISGELHTDFDISFSGNKSHHLNLSGSFEVPTGDYRTSTIASKKPDKNKERYKSRLYTALAISAIIILAFGLR
jgi:hypothetical protein